MSQPPSWLNSQVLNNSGADRPGCGLLRITALPVFCPWDDLSWVLSVGVGDQGKAKEEDSRL